MNRAFASPICPRCKTTLRLLVESESRPKTTNITYLYVCDACKYRKVVDSVTLRMNGNKLMVTRNSFGQRS